MPVCFVVDEDASIRHFLSLILHGAGIDTEEFADGKSFVAGGSRNAAPDLVFLNIGLESGEAIEAIVTLAKRGYFGFVQLMSSRGSAVLEHVKSVGEQHRLQMLPVLKKPFETSAITRIMQELKLGHPAPMAARIGLDEALRKGWIEFWHQPKIDLRKKQLAGVEAFARARHPQYGILPPGAFMPGATESELVALSELALASVLKAGLNFAKLGINLRFAVNIPVNALVKLSIPDIVRAHRAQVDNWPGLIIDVTEEQIVTDLALANDMTKRLAHLNVKLAIDDFGRGYSSLARLKELPFAELKLDRTFVSDCGTDKVNAPALQDGDRPRAQFRQRGGRHRHREGVRCARADQHGLRPRPGLPAGTADAGGAVPVAAAPARRRHKAARRLGGNRSASRSTAGADLRSVRPGIAALESKIVGIGDHRGAPSASARQLIGDAVTLGIGDRLLLGVEMQADLLAHVARAGPAHQRLDLTRLLPARSRAPIPWFWRCPTASRSSPACRFVRSWICVSRSIGLETHCDRRGWSGQQDLNLRPEVPKTSALPGCAIPRTPHGASIHGSDLTGKAD